MCSEQEVQLDEMWDCGPCNIFQVLFSFSTCEDPVRILPVLLYPNTAPTP